MSDVGRCRTKDDVSGGSRWPPAEHECPEGSQEGVGLEPGEGAGHSHARCGLISVATKVGPESMRGTMVPIFLVAEAKVSLCVMA